VKRIVLLGVAVALLWFVWRQEKAAAPSASSVADVQAPPAHVRTLANASERQQISDRIAHAHSVPVQPSLPPAEPEPANPELPKETVRAAMREVVMHLLDCYESASPLEPLDVVAHLTLTGDPDVGTLIDASQIFDDKGAAIPPKLDDCLRGELQMLELPPLAEGNRVTIDYPLGFHPAVAAFSTGSDDDGDDDDDDL